VKNKVIPSKEVLEYLHGLIQKIELWYKLFNENDIENMLKVKTLDRKLHIEGFKTMESCKQNEKVIMHCLMDIKESIHNMTEELG
jgi:hypothetical protein